MDNTKSKKVTLGDAKLYANESRYNIYVENKMKVFRILFLISAIASLISMFIIPMYKYEMLGRKKGQTRIMGSYTPEYIIEKYFNMTLGPHTIFNTGLVIAIVVMMILTLYLTVGAVLNLAAKKLMDSQGFVSRLFNYGLLEIIAVALFICLFLTMVFCKVDVLGNAVNIEGFWIVFVGSIVMTCTSISLSTK